MKQIVTIIIIILCHYHSLLDIDLLSSYPYVYLPIAGMFLACVTTSILRSAKIKFRCVKTIKNAFAENKFRFEYILKLNYLLSAVFGKSDAMNSSVDLDH